MKVLSYKKGYSKDKVVETRNSKTHTIPRNKTFDALKYVFLYKKIDDILYNAFIDCDHKVINSYLKYSYLGPKKLPKVHREYLFEQVCSKGDISLAKILLYVFKIKINLKSSDLTFFYFACYNGRLEMVKFLLEYYNFDLSDDSSAIYMTVFSNNMEIIKLLLERGAKSDYLPSDQDIFNCPQRLELKGFLIRYNKLKEIT